MKPKELKTCLDELYRTFDLGFLATDPLEFVHRYDTPEDREIVGLISSSLAYGRVDTIKKSIARVMAVMGPSPRGFTLKFDPKSAVEAAESRAKLLELFDGHSIFVEEIPNGYCSEWCCKHLPWFVVTTKLGRITIGWRKRVISIEWKDSMIKKTAQELFEKEDVTKWDTGIHAWGYDKAKEYIKILLSNENGKN